MIPTIWPWRRAKATTRPARQLPIGAAVARALVADLAERCGDFTIPFADAPVMEIGPFQRDPADDPTRCCERCEHLTELIRQAGGARGMDAGLASWFERQMEAIHR